MTLPSCESIIVEFIRHLPLAFENDQCVPLGSDRLNETPS